MQVAITPAFVDGLKCDLRNALPAVRSSHRTEAIARGLGWSTNAAMRAALTPSPIERRISAEAFVLYLATRGFDVESLDLIRAILRVQIRAVQKGRTDLTRFGFGVYRPERLSVEEWHAEFAKQRASMLEGDSIFEFQRACEYLTRLTAIKNVNRKHSSYGLKHSAERYHRGSAYADRPERAYVANGMLIAAAYHLGLRVVRIAPSSPNAYLNVSTRSIRDIAIDKKKIQQKLQQLEPEPGEPFRVLGHARGSIFYFPANADRIVTLRAAAHTPAKLVKLAPLEHWISLFPPRNRRSPFDTMAAVGSLFRQAFAAGIYEPPEP